MSKDNVTKIIESQTLSGFLVDLGPALGWKGRFGAFKAVTNKIRNEGYPVTRKRYGSLGATYRAYIEAVPTSVVRKAFDMTLTNVTTTTTKAKPTNNGPPIEDNLVTLRKVVSTLNAVVEQLEAARAINNALRSEIARLSVKARSAMVVYGD